MLWLIVATVIMFCIFLSVCSQYSLHISTTIPSISFWLLFYGRWIIAYSMWCWSPKIGQEAYIIASKVLQPYHSSFWFLERRYHSHLFASTKNTMTCVIKIRKHIQENWNSGWFMKRVYCSTYRHRYWALLQELICVYSYVYFLKL